MRCRKARWYLSARCDGTLSERQRGRLDDHLASCSECRREAFYFSEIAASAGRMESVSVRPDFDLRLRAAIHRAETAPSRTQSWYQLMISRPWRPVLAVCSMILVLGLSYGAYRASTNSSPSNVLQAQAPTDPKSTLEYFGTLVSGTRPAGMPSGWLAVDGSSPESRRLQSLYLNASQGPNDYVSQTVGLDDSNAAKPGANYVMPVVRSDDMARKVSY
ncbi:MAG: zf-HC2 domain-containing protein [candidate division Zixibacteria bacterium]|nr:zf-HC2 domain-containing protein [candidate division Zixibacteria bacterium]